MQAAIRAAIITLLALALLCVLIVGVKMLFDRQKPLSLRSVRSSSKSRGIGIAKAEKTLSSAQSTDDEDFGEKKSLFGPRFAFLQIFVGGLLTTLFVKMWSMQLLNYSSYLKKAESNRTTTYTTRAVRGRVLDCNGVELIGNRISPTIVADSEVADNRNVVHRLSNVLGIPRQAVRQKIRSTVEGAQAKRVVASDVDMRVISFIEEHSSAFPGVYVETRTVRTYPQGDLACHVLGYTGTISEEQLAQSKVTEGISYESDDVVGKSGVELAFENVLQGIRGVNTVEVDAQGNVTNVLDSVAPKMGQDIRLTIDVNVQKAAEEAILEAFERSSEVYGFKNADAGAIVALDLLDGGVKAMASYPTYSPSKFIGGISSELWESLTSDDSGWPLTNRAISGLYPAASTFKPFGSMAALKSGYADSESIWNCEGVWTGMGEEWAKKCWATDGHGWLSLSSALKESCDIVFYNIAMDFYRNREQEPNALQDGLKEWGFEAKTEFELSGEAVGRVPTAEWKQKYNEDTPEYASWLPGDMANLIIGQGDVLITPLQNAVAYSGIAVGKCLKPHILKDVVSREGEVLISKGLEFVHEPEFKEEDIALVRKGLNAQGAANPFISDFQIPTAGKTGTGQVAGKDDYGWYVGYAPVNEPRYLVACMIEQGGSGGSICTPAVRKVLASMFGIDDTGVDSNYLDQSR